MILHIVTSKSKIPSNNWAVIVCSSRYWFNYRHLSNALSIYQIVKRFGIPDNNIIFMNALSQVPCDSRNNIPSSVINSQNTDLFDNLYSDVKTDFYGYDVNVKSFLQLLTDRHEDNIISTKRLLSNENSRILIYLTGHGGDEFFKFHDNEEISAQEIGQAFLEMEIKKR
jgi:phosphatidylinositol glycan class K